MSLIFGGASRATRFLGIAITLLVAGCATRPREVTELPCATVTVTKSTSTKATLPESLSVTVSNGSQHIIYFEKVPGGFPGEVHLTVGTNEIILFQRDYFHFITTSFGGVLPFERLLKRRPAVFLLNLNDFTAMATRYSSGGYSTETALAAILQDECSCHCSREDFPFYLQAARLRGDSDLVGTL